MAKASCLGGSLSCRYQDEALGRPLAPLLPCSVAPVVGLLMAWRPEHQRHGIGHGAAAAVVGDGHQVAAAAQQRPRRGLQRRDLRGPQPAWQAAGVAREGEARHGDAAVLQDAQALAPQELLTAPEAAYVMDGKGKGLLMGIWKARVLHIGLTTPAPGGLRSSSLERPASRRVSQDPGARRSAGHRAPPPAPPWLALDHHRLLINSCNGNPHLQKIEIDLHFKPSFLRQEWETSLGGLGSAPLTIYHLNLLRYSLSTAVTTNGYVAKAALPGAPVLEMGCGDSAYGKLTDEACALALKESCVGDQMPRHGLMMPSLSTSILNYIYIIILDI